MILVTGATGHAGRAVVCRLASLGHAMVAIRDVRAAIGILELTIPRWLCIRLYEAKASQTKSSSQTKASEQNH
jgi:nucleoside-diphosphate-sugar epimerase